MKRRKTNGKSNSLNILRPKRNITTAENISTIENDVKVNISP
jgi:hypothetical protein